MVRLISSLVHWAEKYCNGKVVLVLEGGYDLQAASACASGVTAALLDQNWEDPLGPAPYKEQPGWQRMVSQAKKIWRV